MASKQALINFARRRARRYGIDPDIFVAQIQQESGFKPQITSPAGAQGIAQIMPDTARGWGVDPNRPRQALDAAAKNMASYVKQYGGYENALRAYNAGPGNIKASHGFGETNAYVATILGNARKAGGGHVDTAGQQAAQQDSTVSSLLKFGQDKVGTKQSFDAAAFEQARKRALVGAFISKRRPGSVLSEVLPTEAPDPRDFIKNSVTFKPGKLSIDNQKNTTTTTPAAGVPRKGKIKTFDGKPVVEAFLPELQWARQHGWTGTVTSGVRTKEQQLAAAKNFGLQHYPNGPLASNHVVGHRGAVDVSQPDQLEQILRKYPGKRYLRRGMADDPVHFSPTGH